MAGGRRIGILKVEFYTHVDEDSDQYIHSFLLIALVFIARL